MDNSLKSTLWARSLYTYFLIFLQIPYTYLVYKIAIYFLNNLDWSIQGNYFIFLIPLVWVIFVRAIFLTPKFINRVFTGYVRLDETTDVRTNYGGTALSRLTRAFATVCQKADYYPQVTFYLYPRFADKVDKLKEANTAVTKYGGEIRLLISEITLDHISDLDLEALLAHELSHLYMKNHFMNTLSAIASIPSNVFTLFLIWTLAWISLWYLIPAIFVIGFIKAFMMNQPIRSIESTADYFATKLGYHKGLINTLEYMQDRYGEILPSDSASQLGLTDHPSISSRIAKIKEVVSK